MQNKMERPPVQGEAASRIWGPGECPWQLGISLTNQQQHQPYPGRGPLEMG